HQRSPRLCLSLISGVRSATCVRPLLSFLQPARLAMPCRSSTPPKRRFPIPAASNSSSRKEPAPSPRAALKHGNSTTRRNSRTIAPRSELRPTGSAGASPSTALIGRRPSFCWLCMHVLERRQPAPEAVALRRRRRVQCMWEPSHDPMAPARLCAANGPARIVEPSGPVVAVASRSAAAAAHYVSSDAPFVRNLAQTGDAATHALVADIAALDPCRAGDRCCRRTVVESAACDFQREVIDGGSCRRRLPGGRQLGHPHAHAG